MNYFEITFAKVGNEDFVFDLLAEELGDIGFESFLTDTQAFKAYVAENKFNAEKLQNLLKNFEFAKNLTFSQKSVEAKNWNEEWEKNFFQPIVIDDKCVIHSSFHRNIPTAKYDIVIDPKMAFGTGHHETTGLMIRFILENELHRKNVLDMGCGTAILAILAIMRGAKHALAVDIDDWCVRNSLENIALNNCKNIEVVKGDVAAIFGKKFDVIFANINRNILLNDMTHYAKSLNKNGELFMSGFYEEDIQILENKANKYGLKLIETKVNNRWAAVKLKIENT